MLVLMKIIHAHTYTQTNVSIIIKEKGDINLRERRHMGGFEGKGGNGGRMKMWKVIIFHFN